MTAPSYTEDLTDIDLAEGSSGWAEGASPWNAQGAPAYQDGDYPYIQGSYSVTQDCSKTGIGSLIANNGSGITLPTDGAYFVWQNFSSPPILDTYANGGMRVIVGSDTSNFKSWDVGGKDKGRMPYGGWQNHVVNPSETADDTVGSPTATEQYVGAAVLTTAGISKGEVHQVDAIRYGRGSSIFEHGDVSNGYCTFAGFAAQNDNNSNMWGLIQAVAGGFLWKGKMTIGTTSNACNFVDSDVLVLIDDTPKVTANFNTIEFNNSSTTVTWSNIIFKALGSQSPGRMLVYDNPNVDLEACQFFDMGAFTMGGANSEFLNCIWKNCGVINAAGGKLNGSQILTPSLTSGSVIQWYANTDPDGKLDNLTITKGSGTHRAIYFGTASPTTMTIRGLNASGFNASNGQSDSVFYVARTTGDVTINCVGCTGTMSYHSAGANVSIVSDPVTLQVTAKTATGTVVENARVMLKCKDATGPFHYNVTVTASAVLNLVTIAHSSHTVKVNDHVLIEGANEAYYNGVKKIVSIVAGTSYSYDADQFPTTPATGTIKSTFVPLYGLTNASGIISDSRVYSSDQPVTGWARKSSASPFYKTAPIDEVVDSADGVATTAILIADE